MKKTKGNKKPMKKKKLVKKTAKKAAKIVARKPVKKPARKAKPAKKPAKKTGKMAKKPTAPITKRPERRREGIDIHSDMKRVTEPRRKTEFEVKIQNIVAFTDLGAKISLEQVLQKLENTEYQPEQFPGLIYRMQSPRASALVFSQGKIVCTGTKSMPALKEAMENIVANLRSVGFRLPKKYKTTVENIVASSAIDADLDLDDIAFKLENSEYEPEQFPGLVYRISQPRVAFLLFKSGRIIITGGRTVDEIHEALGIFKKNLEAIGVKLKPAKSKK
jgi:transcription initiation factor TFIID TATA-box-binding protein